MAEQGHKARASAARLEDTGTPPVSASNMDGKSASEAGSEERGMMPLRCSVSGRQAGVCTGEVIANYGQVWLRLLTMLDIWSMHDMNLTPHSLLEL